MLITGASRGIGAATARLFARQGYGVGIHYHTAQARAQALAEELRELGVPVGLYPCDVSRPGEVREMTAAFLRDFDTLDVLVCNAGIARQELFTDITQADWREMLGVNLDGVFHCCQAALPHMIHRKQGKIITLSSMWGQVGASCEVAYSAAKAGVIGLTRALAKELGPSGITVNCVAPGVIDTEMNRQLSQETKAALAEETPLCRIGQPEEVAEAFQQLESQGKVLHFGVSNFSARQLELLQSGLKQKLRANQMQFGIMCAGMVSHSLEANTHFPNAADRDGEVLDYCRLKGITIQAWSPFQYGFFEGVFIDNEKFPALNEKLQQLSEKYGVSKSALAVAWILRHPAGIQAIVGTTKAQRLADIATAADIQLSREDWYQIYLAAGNKLP